jgi:hypothetical protein
VLRHGGEDDANPSDTRTMRLFHRFIPTTDELDGQKLFTKKNGKRFATPLLATAGAFFTIAIIVNMSLFYIHERIWNRVKWGKVLLKKSLVKK